MTIPAEYSNASVVFDRFLEDARDRAGLATRNQTYTMVQGVLQVFRARLELEEAIRFAGVLPPLLRAIFIADWDLDAPKRDFSSCEEMTGEVQALRRHHNFSPDTAIADVAAALRKHVDQQAFDRALAALPAEAAAFWAVPA
ncbi:DUF2267 domain-containing protein [Stappia sp. MMSF_3263]|uniref:DUF2267 domain-containing protein n=1 Tax=Stappia sp. MMSF_3263 TaxID=3046693 RepID=UPI00273DB14E|nr:DUF2267 domain-containing protein [Stappia sp. MMSF_3263]